MIKVTIEEFRIHCENYDGVCTACFEWSEGGVEPDAEAYKCEYCGEHTVMGAETAMMNESIEFIEE